MPTLTGLLEIGLRNYFERPEVIEQMKPLRETFQKVIDICTLVGTALQRVADSPPSSGYEPLLKANGYNYIAARGIAHLMVRRGNRIAAERAIFSPVVRAIRFLANPKRSKKAWHKRVILLLTACHETSAIEKIFVDAGLEEFEFVRQLELAAKGNEDAYLRISEIAVGLAPGLSIRRGPKITPESAAHEWFLEVISEIKPSHYTWNPVDKNFTDSVTVATRREFKNNKFNPQPACRRFVAHQRANLSASTVKSS